jgi:hypothetical protein
MTMPMDKEMSMGGMKVMPDGKVMMKKGEMMMKDGDSMMMDGTMGLTMKDGKMMKMMPGGKMMPMKKDMKLMDGCKVMKDGKIITNEGKAGSMMEGDMVSADGKMKQAATK